MVSPAFFIKHTLLSRQHRHCMRTCFYYHLHFSLSVYLELPTTLHNCGSSNLFLRISKALFVVIKSHLCPVKSVNYQFLKDLFLSFTFFHSLMGHLPPSHLRIQFIKAVYMMKSHLGGEG